MTRSELIQRFAQRFPQLTAMDVEAAVKTILDGLSKSLIDGSRAGICGFGSFSVNIRPPRIGGNPKTDERVDVPEKHVPYFTSLAKNCGRRWTFSHLSRGYSASSSSSASSNVFSRFSSVEVMKYRSSKTCSIRTGSTVPTDAAYGKSS